MRATHAVLERLRQELKIEEPVGLRAIAAFMTVGTGAVLEGEALWEALRPAVESALAELRATRQQEGRALAADIGAHRTTLVDLAARLRQATAPLAERFSRRLTEKLDAIRGQPGFEPGRIAQEAALMADRLDVSEELVRLDTHLAARGRACRRRRRGRPQVRLRHPGDRARAQYDCLEGSGRGRCRAGDRRESGAGADA